MRCGNCRCLISQEEADRGAAAAGPGCDTLCEDCGKQTAKKGTMTLREFHNSLLDGITRLWVCGVGCPGGQDFNHDIDTEDEDEYCDMVDLIGNSLGFLYMDVEDIEGCEHTITTSLWELEGEIEEGQWVWNGEDNPTDHKGNSFYNLKAS